MSEPKYNTLREFLDAKERGEVPKNARVVYWSSTDSVTVEVPRGVHRTVLYKADSPLDFMHAFAEAVGLKGMTS